MWTRVPLDDYGLPYTPTRPPCAVSVRRGLEQAPLYPEPSLSELVGIRCHFAKNDLCITIFDVDAEDIEAGHRKQQHFLLVWELAHAANVGGRCVLRITIDSEEDAVCAGK